MNRIQKLITLATYLVFTGALLSSCSYHTTKGFNGRNHFSSTDKHASLVEPPLQVQPVASEGMQDDEDKPSSSLAIASGYSTSTGLAIALSGDDNLAK